ncbi:Uncharacterized protein DAT39_021504 [Clarias magur]|uniref:Uncharacterized protein n=1 Tax=Clarias magur TaxID=1594786 RepID=A0A8J4WQP8_CLAMG|nr:Uncharacterized protein DAT39_021504 [Clarias magur]
MSVAVGWSGGVGGAGPADEVKPCHLFYQLALLPDDVHSGSKSLTPTEILCCIYVLSEIRTGDTTETKARRKNHKQANVR